MSVWLVPKPVALSDPGSFRNGLRISECRRKTVPIRYLISWWASCYSSLAIRLLKKAVKTVWKQKLKQTLSCNTNTISAMCCDCDVDVTDYLTDWLTDCCRWPSIIACQKLDCVSRSRPPGRNFIGCQCDSHSSLQVAEWPVTAVPSSNVATCAVPPGW